MIPEEEPKKQLRFEDYALTTRKKHPFRLVDLVRTSNGYLDTVSIAMLYTLSKVGLKLPASVEIPVLRSTQFSFIFAVMYWVTQKFKRETTHTE